MPGQTLSSSSRGSPTPSVLDEVVEEANSVGVNRMRSSPRCQCGARGTGSPLEAKGASSVMEELCRRNYYSSEAPRSPVQTQLRSRIPNKTRECPSV